MTLGGSCSAGVGACARTGVVSCVGGAASCNATPGTPSAEVCDNIDNNCNGTVDEGVKVSCYADPDNDRYATNTNASDFCPDPMRAAAGNCPVGYVSPAVSLGVDCNPNDPGLYRTDLVSIDADNDGRCNGAGTSTCVGTSAGPGKRFTSQCSASSDCDDSNAGIYQYLSVRTDGDGDGYCIGNAANQCSGTNPNAGTRVATSCVGTDCKDNNNLATSVCLFNDGFTSSHAIKSCNIGPPPTETFNVQPTANCPPGFSVTNIRTQVNAPATCRANGTGQVVVSCGGVVFGVVDCRIVADCVAN